MSFIELLDQTELLVSSLMLHLHQMQGADRRVAPLLPNKEVKAAPLPVTSLPAVAKKPEKKKEEKPALKTQIQKPPPEQMPAKVEPAKVEFESMLPPSIIHAPFLQLISTIKQSAEKPYLSDILEKLKDSPLLIPEIHDDTAAQKQLAWKNSYPRALLISFFAKGSHEEQFLQKVRDAISSKIIPCHFLSLPTLETAAEFVGFSSSGLLDTAICAYNLPLLSKVQEWLALLPSLEAIHPSQENGPLISKRKHFDTRLYELQLPPSYQQDAAFKATLWKALQKTLPTGS